MLNDTAVVDGTRKERVDSRMLTIGVLPCGLDLLSAPFLYWREMTGYIKSCVKDYIRGRRFIKDLRAMSSGDSIDELVIRHYPEHKPWLQGMNALTV